MYILPTVHGLANYFHEAAERFHKLLDSGFVLDMHEFEMFWACALLMHEMP